MDPLNSNKNLTQNCYLIDSILKSFEESKQKLSDFKNDIEKIIENLDYNFFVDYEKNNENSNVIFSLEQFHKIVSSNIIEKIIQ